jgi:hypothetical protein
MNPAFFPSRTEMAATEDNKGKHDAQRIRRKRNTGSTSRL